MLEVKAVQVPHLVVAVPEVLVLVPMTAAVAAVAAVQILVVPVMLVLVAVLEVMLVQVVTVAASAAAKQMLLLVLVAVAAEVGFSPPQVITKLPVVAVLALMDRDLTARLELMAQRPLVAAAALVVPMVQTEVQLMLLIAEMAVYTGAVPAVTET